MVNGTDEKEKVRCGLKLPAEQIIRQQVLDAASRARAQMEQTLREGAERRKKNNSSSNLFF